MTYPNLASLLETFLLSRQAANLTPRTVSFYQWQLQPFIEHFESNAILTRITAEAIERYLVKRQKEVAPRSVHAAWRSIRVFCNWLAARYPDWTNPVPQVTGPKLPKNKAPVLDREVLNKLVRCCKNHDFIDDRDRAIFLVLVSSGLRASELLALKQGNINLDNGIVRVERGKGGSERIAIVSPDARLALVDYLRHLLVRGPRRTLWWSRRGPLQYSGLVEIMKRRAKLANVPQPSAHSFRRRWATDMAPRLGLHVVQALGGWENIASLKPYVQLSEQDLLEAYENAR